MYHIHPYEMPALRCTPMRYTLVRYVPVRYSM